MPESDPRNGLARILAPVDLESFFNDYLFKKPLFIPGPEEKFEGIFNWTSLNQILNNTRHDGIRVHLNRVGSTAEELLFTHAVRNVRGEDISRIDVVALYEHLRNGATLVIDSVNEVDSSVATITEAVGAQLSTTQATTVLFSSFGQQPGFSVHWDSRDVYALQVEGEKHWSIYEPSQDAPMNRGDTSIPDSGEPGALVWEGIVKKGDMVYVPRGWWHIVTSTDAPSVHLALGAAPVTGLDYLEWLKKACEAEGLFRRDIPRLTSEEDLEAYNDALISSLMAMLADQPVRNFLNDHRAMSRIQTYASLPDGVGRQYFNMAADQNLRISPLMLETTVERDRIRLRGGGREFSAPLWAEPLIETLSKGVQVQYSEIVDSSTDATREEVIELIGMLISSGYLHKR
ncbi:MAG: cupin domain-containing protein [Rhodospirillum sp.]|nr:cupin domain-containing protein [Rhodospirillum sp.]MCF8488360.1 cupin domain-containing protein [Rhodospirillum sp.]